PTASWCSATARCARAAPMRNCSGVPASTADCSSCSTRPHPNPPASWWTRAVEVAMFRMSRREDAVATSCPNDRLSGVHDDQGEHFLSEYPRIEIRLRLLLE